MSGREDPAQERDTAEGPPADMTLTAVEFDCVELAALRGQMAALSALAARHQVELPPLGRMTAHDGMFALCVRPGRWLVLHPPGSPGAAVAAWQAGAAGIAAVIDLSSALGAFQLCGAADAVRAALARGCRLDLHPEVFPVGHAAATIIAQVSVILVNLADGMLLLTPSTTAGHCREWLEEQGFLTLERDHRQTGLK